MSECIFQVQRKTKTLIYFFQVVAVWAGPWLF